MTRKSAIALALALLLAGTVSAGVIDRYAFNSAQDISVQTLGGAVGYQPIIGTVQDGIIHDIQATVSADLRYVQINVGSGISIIERIDNFQVVTD